MNSQWAQWEINLDDILAYHSRKRRVIKKKEMRDREKFLESLPKLVEEFKKDVDTKTRRTLGYFNSEQQFK